MKKKDREIDDIWLPKPLKEDYAAALDYLTLLFPPAQARKMTARMQAATASGLPILLYYDTHAGHAGFKPTSKVIEDLSLEWAFLAWQLGIE